jgi:hypothetical protein
MVLSRFLNRQRVLYWSSETTSPSCVATGNYNGGIVNVVTKSGSNMFHANAFEFLRNTDLDSRNYFASERAAFRQNQFGGPFGGPIKMVGPSFASLDRLTREGR